MPIDKDAIAQFIGWMGELTMTNPHVQLAFVRQRPGLLITLEGGLPDAPNHANGSRRAADVSGDEPSFREGGPADF